MRRQTTRRPALTTQLVAASPLRCFDPRAKLGMSTCASLAAMLPLERLAIFTGLYVLLLLWAQLLPAAARQAWGLKWLLAVLFAFDWAFVGLDLAAVVTLRITLLVGVFVMFTATTTPDELRLALERLGIPYRYAFSLSIAFQSVNTLDIEWRTIQESQRARAAWLGKPGLRSYVLRLRTWVALTVPAIVLTTRRAWAITEAAYARGFESPHRRPYRQLAMRPRDWLIATMLLATVALLAL